jgi:hypothetical protein
MNETDKNGRLVKKWDVKDVEELKSLVEELEEVKLERDALWVKTQEDERIINDLRDANKELRQWKEEALKVMNQWNEVSDYINFNAEVEDIGRFVPQICLKYLKERDELILLEESIKVLTDERNRWHELFEEGVKQQREVEEQRDEALLIAHNLKEAIESTFTASKDPFNADSSYEYIETHGWTHEILKFAREEIKKLEVT